MIKISPPSPPQFTDAASVYAAARITHWNKNDHKNRTWSNIKHYYRKRLSEIYSFAVPEGKRVLELGCGEGDLLAALKPGYGVGVDFSSMAVKVAKCRHSHLHIIETNAQDFAVNETFDYIICSDLLNELWDVQSFFASIKKLCHPETRLILNIHSNLWQQPRKLAERLGVAPPQMIQNWLTPEDISNFFYLTGFEEVRKSAEILCPIKLPIISTLCNKFLVKLWPFNFFALTNFVVARPAFEKLRSEPIVSVIVPAHTEAGNIPEIFDRIPAMGRGTEIVFVEGGSTDDTYEVIEREINLRKRPMTKLFRQTGIGKGDAVRVGIENSIGELLIILDSDLTVAPEDLPRFYEAWLSGKGDFINGVRLVYPMDDGAMQFFNLLGNKFFSRAFSFLIGQNIKDTACGTKVFSRACYELIVKNRAYFGNFDLFGDWDLIFGAAKYNLKIVDMPVRYRSRFYGETKMKRWKIGFLLLRMVMVGLGRLKFV